MHLNARTLNPHQMSKVRFKEFFGGRIEQLDLDARVKGDLLDRLLPIVYDKGIVPAVNWRLASHVVRMKRHIGNGVPGLNPANWRMMMPLMAHYPHIMPLPPRRLPEYPESRVANRPVIRIKPEVAARLRFQSAPDHRFFACHPIALDE
jgi:hypothetical protein